MNGIPKVVLFSTALSDNQATWPTTRVARATEIAAIKEKPSPDVIA